MRFIGASRAACVGIAYGGYLIWKGITGDVWRSSISGDVVVPRWLYFVSGTLLILLGLGWFATAALLSNR